MGRKSRAKRDRRIEAGAQADARRRRLERAAADGERRGCLICRQRDGGFTGVEHIIPESLGNHEKVLPPGVVCDRCNHACSVLDKALIEFVPIKMMKTWHGVPGKKGRLPHTQFNNGSLVSKAPGEVALTLDDESAITRNIPAPPGHHGFRFTAEFAEPRPKQLERVHRALVKQALEFAWLDHPESLVLGPTFDRERHLILHGGHPGYLLMPRTSHPAGAGIQFTYQLVQRRCDGHPLVAIHFSCWGVSIVTDSLLPAPAGRHLDAFNVVSFGPQDKPQVDLAA